MPAILNAPKRIAVESSATGIKLVTADGKPTLEAQILEHFLDGANFDALFADPDIRRYTQTSESYARDVNGSWQSCQPRDKGAVPVVVETIPGDVAALLIDEDDLRGMLTLHIVQELPEDTIVSRTVRAVGLAMLSEADVVSMSEFLTGDLAEAKRSATGKDAGAYLTAALKEATIARARPRGKVQESWRKLRAKPIAEADWKKTGASIKHVAPKSMVARKAAFEAIKAAGTSHRVQESATQGPRATIYEASDPMAMTRAVMAEMARPGQAPQVVTSPK